MARKRSFIADRPVNSDLNILLTAGRAPAFKFQVHANTDLAVLPDMSSPNSPSDILAEDQIPRPELDARFTKDFGFIPIPHRLRYFPEKPFQFGVVLNISFGFASTFSESVKELKIRDVLIT
jgi:hypothetical protein